MASATVPTQGPSSPLSSPLSFLSQSPSPPSPLQLDASKRYPSPSTSTSTAPSGSASPLKMADAPEEIQVRIDGPPPPKRRRLAPPPKPRTTQCIDLEQRDAEQEAQLDRLLVALRKKKKIVVIAGAGISVSAGIPDFRSSTGLFATLRDQHKLKTSGKHLFDASVYKHDASTSSFHTMVRELAHITSKARPTPFHHMLASIAEEGRLMRLYSQNVDGIDTQMAPLATTVPLNTKGPWPKTVQLHGGLEKMVCTKCGHLEPFNGLLFDGPVPPLCEKCKEQDEVRTSFAGKRSHGIGRLRPRIVLYNEYNPDEEAIGNVSKADLRRVPDAVIVVGTSLKIPGVRRLVKEMCQLTRSRRDGITAWINIDPEPQGAEFKDCWDLVIRGKCDDIAELVNLPRWNEQDIGEREAYMVTGDEDREKRLEANLSRARIDVLLERKRKRAADAISTASSQETIPEPRSKLVEGVQSGILTPSASPKLRSPLPSGKPSSKPAGAKATKTKQSTLVFRGQTPATAAAKDDASDASRATSAAAATAKATKTTKTTKTAKQQQRKPRAKKEKAQPVVRGGAGSLAGTFRATKNVAASSGAGSKAARKKEESFTLWTDPIGPSSTTPPPPSSLPHGGKLASSPVLPSLRPAGKVAVATATVSSAGVKHEDAPSSPLTCFTASSIPSTPVMKPSSLETISPSSKPKAMGHLID